MLAGQTDETCIVLILEYDGTAYHGSQWQAGAATIQGEVEKALEKLTGQKMRIKSAGRTDAGVHAMGQVVSFRTDSPLPLDAYIDGLNHYLPRDIAVKRACRADWRFDARRQATSREYRYSILNSRTRSPLRRLFSWQVEEKLDAEIMNSAAQALVGRNDFASFVSISTARTKKTVRSVFKAEVRRQDEMVIFDMTADSFLPHQVRNTVGSLVRVGTGRMTADEFRNLVENPSPGTAGPMAPAAGLCLVRVNYPDLLHGDTP